MMPKRDPAHRLVNVIGQRARDLRLEAKLSLQQTARRSGLSVSTILSFEHGRANFTLETLRRLAAGLGVEVFDLLNVDRSVRAQVIDLTRGMSDADLEKLNRDLDEILGRKR